MKSVRDLQLLLWRESCRHIDIAESIGDLAAVMNQFVALRTMSIFALDGDRVVLVASTESVGASLRFSVDGEDAAAVRRFAAKGGLCLVNAGRPGKSLLRSLAPALGGSRAICGGLMRDEKPEGIVAWQLDARAELTGRASQHLASALEPLAVALDTSRRFHELEDLRRAAEADRSSALRRLGRETLSEPIVGMSGGLSQIIERVSIVATQNVPVLIFGETGSGKEVIARAVHEKSARHEGPFVRVNCGAIPSELIDSQLFGHERGAFTGATEQRLGWFERAHNGTLFLDEIGELPLAAQVRLLRVLQEGILERVGGQSSVAVDCRIIAATHRDLVEMVRAKTFREDLWYRLAVFPLVLPPLRERPQDLPDLVRHFAHKASVKFGLPDFVVEAADLELIGGYDWPGNIRELAAVIDRAALLGSQHRLALSAAMGSTSHGPRNVERRSDARGSGPVPTLDASVRMAIESALAASRGRVEGRYGAAELLDVNPNTLRSKIRKYRIDPSVFRAPI